jgi:hypothetical protein
MDQHPIEDKKTKLSDLFTLKMEWTDELKEEIRERHLVQIRVYLLVITALLPFAVIFYYFIWLNLGFRFGGNFD